LCRKWQKRGVKAHPKCGKSSQGKEKSRGRGKAKRPEKLKKIAH